MAQDDDHFEIRPGRIGARGGRKPGMQAKILARTARLGGNPRRVGGSSSNPRSSAPRTGRFNARGRGAKFAAAFPRGSVWSVDGRSGMRVRPRRVAVKARVVKLAGKAGAVGAHLRYLERDGVSREGEPGRFYSTFADEVDGKELAHVSADAAADWRSVILPAVNAFMVSDAFRGSHITTGTVLQTDSNTYWLCVSPACDLEPRDDGPVVLQLIRLTKSTTLPKVFSTGEYLAIAGDNGPIILQALHTGSRQPSLKVAFLPGGTRVVRDAAAPEAAPTITGWFATGASPTWLPPGVDAGPATDGPAPPAAISAPPENGETAIDAAQEALPIEAQPITTDAPTIFTVASQLRNAFATRFLLTAGQHLSRIGVDFVDS